jgi:hypothetical protein
MGEPFRVGYCRCSTDEQDVEIQIEQLLTLGVPRERIFVDKGFSGTTSKNRIGLDNALAAVTSAAAAVSSRPVVLTARDWGRLGSAFPSRSARRRSLPGRPVPRSRRRKEPWRRRYCVGELRQPHVDCGIASSSA